MAADISRAGNHMLPKVLIVEDHQDTARMLAKLLSHSGYNVAVAHSYHDALVVAEAERPDIALCDIGLPDGDGCELLRQLQHHFNIAGIAATGYATPNDHSRCIKAGFTQVVVKPYVFDRIIKAIENVGRVTKIGGAANPWQVPPESGNGTDNGFAPDHRSFQL